MVIYLHLKCQFQFLIFYRAKQINPKFLDGVGSQFLQ